MTLLRNLQERLALIVLATAAAACGCNREPAPEPEPELDLKTTEISVSADGGTYSVGYELRNAPEGDIPEASSEATWVGEFSYTKDLISFTVQANPSSEEAREAEVQVKYQDIAKTFKVTQPANSRYDKFTIDIKVNSAADRSVNVTATPSDDKEAYFVSAIPKEDLGDERDLIDSLTTKFIEDAAGYGLTTEEYLKTYIVKTGKTTMDIVGLKSATDYYVYAFGMSYDAAPTTGLFKTETRTSDAAGPSDVTFELTAEADGKTVTMTATPSDNEARYHFGYLAYSYLEYLGLDIEGAVQNRIDDELMYGTEAGMTVEEIIDELSFFGQTKIRAELTPGVDYVIYAAAISDQGEIISDVAHIDFALETATSDNVLTIEVSEIGADYALLKVNATNDDPYAIAMVNASSWAGLTDQQMAEAAVAAGLITKWSGNYQKQLLSLRPDNDYLVIAFGYDEPTITTAVTKEYFRTESVTEMEDLQFTFEITDITTRGALITVKAVPETSLYFWYAKPSSMTEEDIKAEYEDIIRRYLESGMIGSRLDYFKSAGSRGTDYLELKKLESDTEYRAFAIGINETNGSYSTPMAFSDPFRTLKNEKADIKVEVNVPHYYDGNEIITAGYDWYEQAFGKAIAILEPSVSGSDECTEYYFHMMDIDATDTSLYTDEAVIEILLSYGFRNEPSVQAIVSYDKVYTLIGVGHDKSGNTGDVFRKTVTFTKDGVSDLSTFVPMQTPGKRPELTGKSLLELPAQGISGHLCETR